MKYLKKYIEASSYRSDILQEWIQPIHRTCLDILLELDDFGMTTSVRRSNFMEERDYVVIECFMSYPSPSRWGRFGVIEVYDRLASYLGSKGFVETGRRTGNVQNFPIVNGKYEGKIAFKKFNLDRDIITDEVRSEYLKRF